jgi:lipoprotein-anchoring transpeptidase ErfK/SrfK
MNKVKGEEIGIRPWHAGRPTEEFHEEFHRHLKPSKLPLGKSTREDVSAIWRGPNEPGLYIDQINNYTYFVKPDRMTVYRYDSVTAKDPAKRLTQRSYVGIRNLADPSWIPPPNIQAEIQDETGEEITYVEGGSPLNPKGAAQLQIGDSDMLLHGNNMKHFKRGHFSHGCIRLTNYDAYELAETVPDHYPIIPYEVKDSQQRGEQAVVAKINFRVGKNTLLSKISKKYRTQIQRTSSKAKNATLRRQARLARKSKYKQVIKFTMSGHIAHRKRRNA